MNINEAKAIIEQLNDLNYLATASHIELANEAIKVAIRTAIAKPGHLENGTAWETALNTLFDYGFKKINLEIGIFRANDGARMSCLIHSILLDDGGIELVDLTFDKIVAGIIEIDERNIAAKARYDEFKKQKKELKERLELLQERIPRMNNGLEDKVVFKVNQLNTIDINLSNIDEDKLRQIVEKLEEIR